MLCRQPSLEGLNITSMLNFGLQPPIKCGIFSLLLESGRSAVRQARLLWEQKVGGSNPLAPINESKINMRRLQFQDGAPDSKHD